MKPKKASYETKLDKVYRLAVKNGSYILSNCFVIQLKDLKKIIDSVKSKRGSK